MKITISTIISFVFILSGLQDEGIYNFTCSYISYQTQNYQAIKIKADDVTIINIHLDEAQVALDEVYVVARASRRTEAALQVLQRRSSVVLDGISAQQISRLGDSDAAGALKRVTGVSVEGGKYIYVRGLSDRYSKTLFIKHSLPTFRQASPVDILISLPKIFLRSIRFSYLLHLNSIQFPILIRIT